MDSALAFTGRFRRPRAGSIVNWYRIAQCLVATLVGAALDGCLAWVPTGQEPPTIEDGSVYRGYGDAIVHSRTTDDGCCRVWWVEHGEHAASPEHAAEVAAIAQRVWQVLATAGFRRPRPSAVTGADAPRLDIYLVQFQRGDGAWVANACRGRRCGGFVVMHHEPGSEPVVLLSHELFHASQSAYTSELPAWFSEGTATWFEEFFWPDQSDFERLASRFFEHPGRSLNDVVGVTDSFGYSTALFFYFLDRRFGPEVLADTLRQIGRRRSVEQAMVSAVEPRAPFPEEFLRFWGWNLLTGEFAPVEGEWPDGYQQARDWPAIASTELPSFPMAWWVTVEPWAAQVATLRGNVRSGIPPSLTVDWSLETDENGPTSEVGVVAAWLDASGSPHLRLTSAPPLSVRLGGAQFVRIAVVNSSWQTSTDVRVSLY